MITTKHGPVSIEAVDRARGEASVKDVKGRIHLVAISQLQGTGGTSEVMQAVQAVDMLQKRESLQRR